METSLPKPLLLVEETMQEGTVLELPSGRLGIFSHRSHLKHDEANEDAALVVSVSPTHTVLALADGVGGIRGGKQASRQALEDLLASVEQETAQPDNLREAILRGFERANQSVIASGIGSATTMAVALIEGKQTRFFHAGDSMILLMGQRGKIRFQTTMHSPVGYAIQAGYLEEEEAMHHDERHLVSNVVGSLDMSIEMGPSIEIRPRDTLILATDGLFDNLHVEEVIDRARKGPMEKALSSLTEDCLQRMQTPEEGQPSKADDLTIIVYRPRR